MGQIQAPRWGGTMASTNLLAGEAGQDASQGLAMTMAKLQHEMDQRSQLMMILQKMKADRAAQKAASASGKGSWGGLIGAGGGAIAGLALAPFTAGGSLGLTAAGAGMLNAGMGAGLGGTIGSGIDQAMGGRGSNLGSNLLDFSTDFARMGSRMPQQDMGQFYFEPYPQAGSGGDGYKDHWMN